MKYFFPNLKNIWNEIIRVDKAVYRHVTIERGANLRLIEGVGKNVFVLTTIIRFITLIKKAYLQIHFY